MRLRGEGGLPNIRGAGEWRAFFSEIGPRFALLSSSKIPRGSRRLTGRPPRQFVQVMFRELLKSKMHNARVTEANLHYVGSITIDEDLMDAADVVAYEKVSVVNKNNGARFETYVITGDRGSGMICLNGAAARLVQPGDEIIVMTFAQIEAEKARAHQPIVLVLDAENRIVDADYREEPRTAV